MATTTTRLKEWFDRAAAIPGVTHMVIKYDSFDGQDYPVYVGENDDVHKIVARGDQTMEVYKISLGWEVQSGPGTRVFNY